MKWKGREQHWQLCEVQPLFMRGWVWCSTMVEGAAGEMSGRKDLSCHRSHSHTALDCSWQTECRSNFLKFLSLVSSTCAKQRFKNVKNRTSKKDRLFFFLQIQKSTPCLNIWSLALQTKQTLQEKRVHRKAAEWSKARQGVESNPKCLGFKTFNCREEASTLPPRDQGNDGLGLSESNLHFWSIALPAPCLIPAKTHSRASLKFGSY